MLLKIRVVITSVPIMGSEAGLVHHDGSSDGNGYVANGVDNSGHTVSAMATGVNGAVTVGSIGAMINIMSGSTSATPIISNVGSDCIVMTAGPEVNPLS